MTRNYPTKKAGRTVTGETRWENGYIVKTHIAHRFPPPWSVDLAQHVTDYISDDEAIPLSTNGQTARRPSELLVAAKGVLASGLGPGLTAAVSNGTLGALTS